MTSGYVDFNTNRSWATVRVRYSYDSSDFYINDVEVSVTQWINTSRVTDGYIKVNGTTIDSGGLQFIPNTSGFYSLGISGSVSLTSTVTVSFHAKNYSGWFAVTNPADYQFMINDGTSATINTQSGGSGGDSGGSGYVGANTMFINPGEGTKITVYRTWSDEEANRGQYLAKEVTEPIMVTIYYPNDRFHILAEALPGYKIDYYYDSDGDSFPYYTDNLSKFWTNDYDGAWRYQPIYDLSVSIDATATRYSCVRIDDGTNFNSYYCYIDTEYAEYPENDLNCTVDGQRSGYYVPDIDKMNWYHNYDSTGVYHMDCGARWGADAINDQRDEYMVYFLKFTTPDFYSTSEELKIEIKMQNNNNYKESNQTVRYALCTSDENYHLYLDTVDAVSDPYQITTGTFQEVNGDNKVSTILIKTDRLQGNTTYYLLVWDSHKSSSTSDLVHVMPATNHTVTLKRDNSNGPFYYAKFDLYIPYIDNGTSWELL